MVKLCLSILFAASLTQARSLPQCATGQTHELHLVNQFADAYRTSDVTKAVFSKYRLGEALKFNDCGPDIGPLNKKNQKALYQIRERLPRSIKPGLKLSCLKAAVQIKAETGELLCPGEKTDGNKNKHDFCITENMLEYQNSVLTDFHQCVKKLTDSPLKLDSLFEMYSLESNFKPHYAYGGGVGIGQLTSIFVADVVKKGRGLDLLTAVANSNIPECSIAKKIAAKDIQQPSPTLYPKRCGFVQYGEGLERNILYTLVGLANWWKRDIGRLFKNYQIQHQENPVLPKVLEMSLLNAYGSGGTNVGRAAIKRILGKGLIPSEFLKQLQKPMRGNKGTNLTHYTSSIAKKQKDIKNNLPSNETDAFNKAGAQSCLVQ